MRRNELKQGDKVKVILRGTNQNIIHTRNENKIFSIIRKNSKLGINWNEGTPYGLIYGNFASLDGFAPYPYSEFIKVDEGAQ